MVVWKWWLKPRSKRIDSHSRDTIRFSRLPNNLLAINSFGFGGANVHAVLEANANRQKTNPSSHAAGRLAFVCARTADGCAHILKHLQSAENSIELQALMNDNTFHPSHTHPYRGFTMLNSPDTSISVKVIDRLLLFVAVRMTVAVRLEMYQWTTTGLVRLLGHGDPMVRHGTRSHAAEVVPSVNRTECSPIGEVSDRSI